MRIALAGATGTIGRETLRVLLDRGDEVTCFMRNTNPSEVKSSPPLIPGADVRQVDVRDNMSLTRDGFGGERFDAVVSCMASRTGAPKDAWAIDHQAHVNLLIAARKADVAHFVQLSAICVQKPLLAFQHAKLAFEAALVGSGIRYSIVRPTAFFKSLSGQIERVRQGKPYLMFGNGELTACKPISDRDLAGYLADCLVEETRWNKILPIGGPGDAITPRRQGEMLFELLDRPAGRRRRGAGPRGRRVSAPRGEGGARAHRSLLCDRIHALAQSGDDALRRCRDAFHGRGHIVRPLPRGDRGRGQNRPRRPRGVLTLRPR